MQLVDESKDVTVEMLVATADCYQYAGRFLLESQCSGNEVKQHAAAVDLITANFQDLNQKILSHPGFEQWKKDQAAKKAAAEKAAQEAQQKLAVVKS